MNKFIIILSLFLAAILYSCSDNADNSILQPVHNNPILQLEEGEFITSKIIDGKRGGGITFDTAFVNSNGDSVLINVNLEIDSLSFSGSQQISMIPNYKEATIQFFPKMVFNKPLRLTFSISGVDLVGKGFTQGNKPEFVYLFPDGSFELVTTTSTSINWPLKQLKVAQARLNHFSRYAFIRS